MNNSRIWSPNVSSSDEYSSGHHHHPPMTSPSSSHPNSFAFAPLSSSTSACYSNAADLIQEQNSEYVQQHVHHFGYNNNNVLGPNGSGSVRNSSNSTVSGENLCQPPLPLEDNNAANIFQNAAHFASPMGYSPDGSWIYSSPFSHEIIESFHFPDAGFFERFPTHMPHQYPNTGSGILNSAATFVNYLNNGASTMGPPARPRKPGGRRPKEEECKLPPEEEEKRRLRRIRNKEAAARCRKRRLDQMQTLEMKVSELQNHQSQLENDLERLESEKHDLEFILKAHEAICQCTGDIKTFAGQLPSIGNSLKRQLKYEDDDVMLEDDDEEKSMQQQCQDPTLSSVIMTKKSKLSTDTELLTRPNTLPLANDAGSLDTPGFGETPSREYFNLLNQSTGLTPISSGGGLTPLLFNTSTSANCIPSLETPSVAESKIGPNNLTKL